MVSVMWSYFRFPTISRAAPFNTENGVLPALFAGHQQVHAAHNTSHTISALFPTQAYVATIDEQIS